MEKHGYKYMKKSPQFKMKKVEAGVSDQAATVPLPSSKSDRKYGPKKKLTPEY